MTGAALPDRLFPDTGRRDLPRVTILERLLEDGTTADLRLVLEELSLESLQEWLELRGDRLSARSWEFWRWVLGLESHLPRRGVNAFWPDGEGCGPEEPG